jgi:NTP pyrophosphatase (non-canonical NTP hydrolase)
MNKTTEEQHKEMVNNLVKSGESIKEELTPLKTSLWHLTPALVIEAAELADAIKKWVIYNKEIDMENVLEELGDIEFYLQAIRANLGIRREDTLQGNLKKLGIRYGDKYSDEAAQKRADKN